MKRTLRESLHELLDSWGMSRTLAPQGSGTRSVRVKGPSRSGGEVLVGQLWLEGGEFVFRYAESYQRSGEPPIAGFPDLESEYRSRRLWPFFEVRLPPTDREDVRRVIQASGVDEKDPLALLAALGAHTATSPYTLELEDKRPATGRRRLAPAT